MKQKYQSIIMEAIHEEASALFEAGAIDKERMAEYDHACLIQESNKVPDAEKPKSSTSGTKLVTPAYAQKH